MIQVVANSWEPFYFQPPKAGTEEQFRGTHWENLAEAAGRVCYDSYGKGRSSAEFHKNIWEQKHLNIYRHVFVKSEELVKIWVPGVFLSDTGFIVNGEAIVTHNVGKSLFPMVPEQVEGKFEANARAVSVYIECSRGCSHELVRHSWQTAVSQRSTRYCAEGEIADYFKHDSAMVENFDRCLNDYRTMMQKLGKEDRKTARGYARALLPHSLKTKLIFTATLDAWKHIYKMRSSPAADGEIRQMINDVRDVILGRFGLDIGGLSDA